MTFETPRDTNLRNKKASKKRGAVMLLPHCPDCAIRQGAKTPKKIANQKKHANKAGQWLRVNTLAHD